MVFQNYALYPAARRRREPGLPRPRWRAFPGPKSTGGVTWAAEIRGITEQLLTSKPTELSGGQRQRVAIGRAIVREPRSFSSTSRSRISTPNCGSQMRAEITRLQRELGNDHRLRHPQPDRSDDPGRPHRRPQRRHRRADRLAARPLQPSRQSSSSRAFSARRG